MVSISDISHVLPVKKLPSVPPPQVRRRRGGRGSEDDVANGSNGNHQVPVTLEQEMPGEEPDNIDFSECTRGPK